MDLDTVEYVGNGHVKVTFDVDDPDLEAKGTITVERGPYGVWVRFHELGEDFQVLLDLFKPDKPAVKCYSVNGQNVRTIRFLPNGTTEAMLEVI